MKEVWQPLSVRRPSLWRQSGSPVCVCGSYNPLSWLTTTCTHTSLCMTDCASQGVFVLTVCLWITLWLCPEALLLRNQQISKLRQLLHYHNHKHLTVMHVQLTHTSTYKVDHSSELHWCVTVSVCVSVLVWGELPLSVPAFLSLFLVSLCGLLPLPVLPNSQGVCLRCLCVLGFTYWANMLRFLEWGFVTLSVLLAWPSHTLYHMSKQTPQTISVCPDKKRLYSIFLE